MDVPTVTKKEDLLRIADLTPDRREANALTDTHQPCQALADLLTVRERFGSLDWFPPAHRGEEVAAEVIDGERSAVWEQAANRLPIEQAVLHALVTGDREG